MEADRELIIEGGEGRAGEEGLRRGAVRRGAGSCLVCGGCGVSDGLGSRELVPAWLLFIKWPTVTVLCLNENYTS